MGIEMIRRANAEDMIVISGIYAGARKFMASEGNSSQWGEQYPPEEMLIDDIEKGRLYVYEAEGNVHGVFAFILGEDPTYGDIRDGSWMSDEIYGTLHRVASDGTQKGFTKKAVDYCEGITSHLRIDTHEDNKIMQHQILKCGFTRCGIIFVEDGSPRIAFEKL